LKARTILAALAASSAFATHAAEFRALGKAGFELGGETLVTAVFADGDTERVRANEGFYLGGGVAILDGLQSFEYHLTAGFKIAHIEAANGEIDWTRWPLEALAFYRFARWRFGGGLTYHIDPRLEGNGVVGGLDVKFKNALGLVLQADWLVAPNVGLGARFTILEYEVKSPVSGSAQANGFGLAFSVAF
jgi:hypothetical protein